MTMHMAVSDLREERDRYKAEAQWLAELLLVRGAAPAVPREWRLTPTESRIVGLLLTGSQERFFSISYILQAVYWDREEPADGDGTIRPLLTKIRRKLRPFGLTVINDWGRGYRLSPFPGAVVAASLRRDLAVAEPNALCICAFPTLEDLEGAT